MADVRMPESKPCIFDKGLGGKCGKPSDNNWCSEHENLKCDSCGKKAIRGCDSQMGGLGCGSHLCGTCQHVDGKHAKQAVADKYWADRDRFFREGIESEEMLSERGLMPDPDRPHNLRELLLGDKTGYELKEIFSLEIKHGLMGYFPAIFEKPGKRIVATTDISLLIRVWQMLRPTDSDMNINHAWVNDKLGICYVIPQDRTEYYYKESRPMLILTEEEFNRLTEDGKNPFRWAPGIIGAGTSQANFRQIIEKTAERRGIALPANTP